MTTRRGFLTGLAGTVIAAPAIVRASSLMRIKPMREAGLFLSVDGAEVWRMKASGEILADMQGYYQTLIRQHYLGLVERYDDIHVIDRAPPTSR